MTSFSTSEVRDLNSNDYFAIFSSPFVQQMLNFQMGGLLCQLGVWSDANAVQNPEQSYSLVGY